MAENINFTVTVMPYDDFTPQPSLTAQAEMIDSSVAEFRKFLEQKARRGLIVVGFRCDQWKD